MKDLSMKDWLWNRTVSGNSSAAPKIDRKRLSANRRHGYSLVECLVMIALIGAVLNTLVVMLYGLHRADRRWRSAWSDARSFDQFVDRWREDVHAAQAAMAVEAEAQATPGRRRLELSLAQGRRIEYALGNDEVVRIVRAAGGEQHRESFLFALPGDAGWRIDSSRKAPLVWLMLPGQGAPACRLNRLVAAVGLTGGGGT
jgi:hypothetical protein